MIQHPGIMALLGASFLVSLMVAFAGWYGIRILFQWDLHSGAEGQLQLERRTYLISTILTFALGIQILSLFLFIFTADSLHSLLVGAMCAAGSLNANAFGYPTLLLKLVNCVAAGLWLILNHADTKGYDYPLIKAKYGLLMLIIPLVLLEAFLQARFFSGLKADVITSCCGSLFSQGTPGLSGDLAGLPAGPARWAFFGSMAATGLSGAGFLVRRRGGYVFSLFSLVSFGTALAALVSFICLYIYELPTHHCPFCLLQREYGYIGFLLYAALLGGGIAGMGVGVLMPAAGGTSLSAVVPRIQRRLALLSLGLYLVFTVIVLWNMVFSALKLG